MDDEALLAIVIGILPGSTADLICNFKRDQNCDVNKKLRNGCRA